MKLCDVSRIEVIAQNLHIKMYSLFKCDIKIMYIMQMWEEII